jgi:hypothetical protein
MSLKAFPVDSLSIKGSLLQNVSGSLFFNGVKLEAAITVQGNTCAELFTNTPEGTESTRTIFNLIDAPVIGESFIVKSFKLPAPNGLYGYQQAFGFRNGSPVLYRREHRLLGWGSWFLDVLDGSIQNRVIDSLSNTVNADGTYLRVRSFYELGNPSVGVIIPRHRLLVKTNNQVQDGTLSVREANPDGEIREIIGISKDEFNVLNDWRGVCITSGVVSGIDTSSFLKGDVLYHDGTGGFTKVKPNSNKYQVLGYCTRSDVLEGRILIDIQPQILIANTTQQGIVALEDTIVSDDSTKALTAKQGKILNEKIQAHIDDEDGSHLASSITTQGDFLDSNVQEVLENLSSSKINYSDIQDNLTSDDADKPLSAKQGKVLDEKYTNIVSSVNLLRADKFLAAQNIAKMVYDAEGSLIKIRYISDTDDNYEVMNYIDGALSSIDHYVDAELRGTSTLSYQDSVLISVIFQEFQEEDLEEDLEEDDEEDDEEGGE